MCGFYLHAPPCSARISAFKETPSTHPPLVSNGASATSHTPVPAPRPQKDEPRAQFPDSSNSVRQMLQHEMFMLVQVSTSPYKYV